MFTRLDAAYNRCPPVRLWSGSLRGLQRRRVTTRCSKGYRGLAVSGGRLARTANRLPLTIAFSALLLPALLSSQAVDTPRPPTVPPKKLTAPPSPHPEVVNLTLKGVKVVRQDDLRNNIYTTA